MGRILSFDQRCHKHATVSGCTLRIRRFPLLDTQYLEAEIPTKEIRSKTLDAWIESVDRELRQVFSPFEGSHVEIRRSEAITTIHILLDNELEEDEIVDIAISFKSLLENEAHLTIAHDYVT